MITAQVPALGPSVGAQTRPARLWPLLAGLGAASLASWGWALSESRGSPGVLGLSLAAYVFGLRHALDADHIAAIDNVTRNLARRGEAPPSVGLWFSLGHSSVVVLACAGVAVALGATQRWMPAVQVTGGVAGTLISAGFLFAIAVANLILLGRLLRARARNREATASVSPGGPVSAVLGAFLGRVRRAPAMFAVGMLFALGFDTASEIGLIGISAGQAGHAASPWAIMLYPALFTAGMSLADTLDGAVMARAYSWALSGPRRRGAYNLTVTALSAAAALGIGAVELAALAHDRLKLEGRVWSLAAWSLDHWGLVGLATTTLLLGSWALARNAQDHAGSTRREGAAARP